MGSLKISVLLKAGFCEFLNTVKHLYLAIAAFW